jgi:2,3-bisphosphoglycerate-independent phosphoglycerate mutase
MLIIADHGNIERRVDKETGQPHTINLVHIGGDKPLDAGGSLSGLASTVSAMLGRAQPLEITDRSLIKFV